MSETAQAAEPETAYEQLVQRNAELEAEKAELAEQLEAAEQREQELAAHVAKLHETLEPFARAWQHRAPDGTPGTKAYERRLERSLGAFYSTGSLDSPIVLTGTHLRDAARALSAPVSTASLAHRDAEVIASLRFPTMLRKMWSGAEVQQWLSERAAEKRRQAEEPPCEP